MILRSLSRQDRFPRYPKDRSYPQRQVSIITSPYIYLSRPLSVPLGSSSDETSCSQGSAYVFPRENNIDNQPMIRLYTQVNMLNGQKSTMDPQEMRWKVTAEDIMDADKRVSRGQVSLIQGT